MTIEEHIASIELEIQQMNSHGHLQEFELSVCVNAIEHQLFEARRLVENARHDNRSGDILSPDE